MVTMMLGTSRVAFAVLVSTFLFPRARVVAQTTTTTTIPLVTDPIINVTSIPADIEALRPARISCNAAYNAPCSRVNSQWLASHTAQELERMDAAGIAPEEYLFQVTNQTFNLDKGFYPFVFDRSTSVCLAHGSDPTMVGRSLEDIFQQMQIEFSSGAELHDRFVQAANNGGGWVQYFWKQDNIAVGNKVAYVTDVADRYILGVGYDHVQLPTALPCSDRFDSWCSINNVRSLVGKAQFQLNGALSLEQFETILFGISFDAEEFEIPGGYYVFVYRSNGELVAHPKLQAFFGQRAVDFFPQLNREADDGQEIHLKVLAAAQGKNDGWAQFYWRNRPDEDQYVKIAYAVKIVFQGEDYYLGSGYNFIMGDVIGAPLGGRCSSAYNLPCSFGTAQQLTSHALSHAISSSSSVQDVFDAVSHDPMLKRDDFYVFVYDFNRTCVAHGQDSSLVGKTFQDAHTWTNVTTNSAELMDPFVAAANKGGGFVYYPSNVPGVQKVSRVFKVVLEGRNYFGGVTFSHQRAPLQLLQSDGNNALGEPIPCSREYGTNCSEINTQAIVGQALSDLVLASTSTKLGPHFATANETEILASITAGDELYSANDFFVAVFSFDQSSCFNDGTPTDSSGCCLAHGGNASYVGKTWQQILDLQDVVSIRGEALHRNLMSHSDQGGSWFEYSMARHDGSGSMIRSLSSRFKNNQEDHYVVAEYKAVPLPPTCDACPFSMECRHYNQRFCEIKEQKPDLPRSALFIILGIVIVGLPAVGALFCWVGKRREKLQAEAQIREIDQQMQTLNEEMEKEKMTAAQTRKLVSSLFPENVQSQILAQIAEAENRSTTDKLASFLTGGENAKKALHGNVRPIAELFPSATVIFMDIVGFTAWSSTREPEQVFRLLEGVYQQFDRLAKERSVFKVETIGDTWLGVAGLPERMENHAEVMAMFAQDCLRAFRVMVNRLEVSLGPDTGDLRIRTGLHSGPVTAGVLKGDKARFQLFGDTVNTASRLESTGRPGMVQISQATAELLRGAGKGHWCTKRDELIVAKGKGEIATYWLTMNEDDHSTTSANTRSTVKKDKKTSRLILWVTEALMRILKQIHGQRQASKLAASTSPPIPPSTSENLGKTAFDEVCDIIHMPAFSGQDTVDPADVELNPKVAEQLEKFVSGIADMYRDNPFHNFEHVLKLMSRIVAPDLKKARSQLMFASMKHDHTYGITSDPLTHFAVAFSALVHDVDHSGVPNSQVVKENHTLATLYKGRSVAEQHSVDLSWELLMSESFADLRNTIYGNDAANQTRFRQLVVNCVMATDIMDSELKDLRNLRWRKAFNGITKETRKDASDRKATIVIDHLIQASDVSHTMQHWHVYRKWNERLFEEMYTAFLEGRADKDPSEFWYQGEIGFFDFYIIPLAKKLEDCGVFGVSSSEYLGYAEQNRNEWKLRGESIVSEMSQKYRMSLGMSLSHGLGFDIPEEDIVETQQMEIVVELEGSETQQDVV